MDGPKFVRFGGHLIDVIQDHDNGMYEGYDLIITQIKDAGIKSSHLCELLKEFIGVVHLLDKKHKDLVYHLLQIKWVIREKEVIETFHIFARDLVTANPVHIIQVLNSMITHFKLASCISESQEICIAQEEIFQVIHKTIHNIFTLIPLSVNLIYPLLAANYPFMKIGANITEWYVKNLLYITTYEPSIRPQILELVVSKALKLDNLLPRDRIEQSLQKADEMFEMEMKITDSFLETLEVTMETLLQYTHDMCFRDQQLLKESEILLREFVTIFDKVILPVHGCSHIQFLLFFICSFKTTFADYFLDHLWKKVQNPNVPVLFRQTSMSYLASILARAKYISLNTVMESLKLIVSWIHLYIKEREDEGGSRCIQGTAHHGTFYAICQAVFYILIFKHKHIRDHEKGYCFLQNLHLDHIIFCRLNPLKFCINTVVNLFSSIMRSHQIVYCDTVIERNNRQSIPVSGRSELSTPVNPLDSFFPFDPYLLKNSKHFIEDLYQEWEGRVPQPEESKEEIEEHNKDVWNDEDGGIVSSNAIAVPKLIDHEQGHLKLLSGGSMSPGFSLISSLTF